MKKCNIHYIGNDYICFKCHYLWLSNSIFRKYNQFGNLTYLLHFSEVLKIIIIIKYFVG